MRSEVWLLFRGLFLVILLAIPFQAQAAGYVVRAGDTLGAIASRYHVTVGDLARVNGITNVNVIPVGRFLAIPVPARLFSYRVQWGDTLLGISARYGMNIATVRSMNPGLGTYPLAGQWLRLCQPCSSSGPAAPPPPPGYSASSAGSSGAGYIVQAGDTLSAIASRYGVTVGGLMVRNHIVNPNQVVIGTRLSIPTGWAAPYDPWLARSLIVRYAQWYGLEPSFPLAVGWQESGFNENLVSRTGAIGVMQVEPYTGTVISAQLGRQVDLHNIDDNTRAGVYWLAQLVRYYGGNERLAAAAYYQGTRSVARHGLFKDTVQYANDVMALKTGFGG